MILNYQAEDGSFRRIARSILAAATGALGSLGAPHQLSSGTLLGLIIVCIAYGGPASVLGWYRQCNVVTWSKDVDLGIKWRPGLDVDAIIGGLEEAGFQLKMRLGRVRLSKMAKVACFGAK